MCIRDRLIVKENEEEPVVIEEKEDESVIVEENKEEPLVVEEKDVKEDKIVKVEETIKKEDESIKTKRVEEPEKKEEIKIPKPEETDSKILDNTTPSSTSESISSSSDLPELINFSSKPILNPKFEPKEENDHLLQHHLNLLSNFGLNIGFNIPKTDKESEQKFKEETTKNFLKDCKFGEERSEEGLNCIKKLTELQNTKKTPSFEQQDSVQRASLRYKQSVASLGKGNSQTPNNSNKSSARSRIENRNDKKTKIVEIEGDSNLDIENLVQAKAVTLDKNNDEKLLSLTNVKGDEAAKTEITSVGKKNNNDSFNIDLNVKNEGKGENADSFSIVGNKIGGNFNQDMIFVPPTINAIIIPNGKIIS